MHETCTQRHTCESRCLRPDENNLDNFSVENKECVQAHKSSGDNCLCGGSGVFLKLFTFYVRYKLRTPQPVSYCCLEHELTSTLSSVTLSESVCQGSDPDESPIPEIGNKQSRLSIRSLHLLLFNITVTQSLGISLKTHFYLSFPVIHVAAKVNNQ